MHLGSFEAGPFFKKNTFDRFYWETRKCLLIRSAPKRKMSLIYSNCNRTKWSYLSLTINFEILTIRWTDVSCCQPLRFSVLIDVTAEMSFWFVVDAIAQPIQWMVHTMMHVPLHLPYNVWYVHVHTNYWHGWSIPSDQSHSY